MLFVKINNIFISVIKMLGDIQTEGKSIILCEWRCTLIHVHNLDSNVHKNSRGNLTEEGMKSPRMRRVGPAELRNQKCFKALRQLP